MKTEFVQTAWLQLISILFLGIANLLLLNDEWTLFFVFLGIVGFLEWNRYELECALRDHRDAEIQYQKTAVRERQIRILEDIKKKATTKT